ncbi:MAG: hypothetical protein JOZ46_06185 [Candidatus Dormibacteraeota bacterium]|nr:hypothetical protein [Candidatus Dormibacteraeota bacterium]MBV9525387.1 hypothetical protein [Candidatus Dormibacteraeota bacterium]
MEDAQSRADQAEAAAEARYARLQRLMDLLEEPARRADAMLRLEAWLQMHPPPHRDSPGVA